MKKALAFILASFVFASIFFKSIPAKASDFAIPESGWLPVIYDIFYSLVNGNEINVAELAGELSGISAVIDKYDEYRNTHFETGFEGALSLLNNSLFTYASCMYEGDLYDLAAQYSVYLKDGLHPILGRFTKDRVARWNQYNTQYNDIYIDSFTSDSDTPVVNPDVEYLSFIDYINGSEFTNFLSSKSIATYNGYPTMLKWDNSLSYYYIGSSLWVSEDIQSIYIVSNGSTYSYTLSMPLYNNFLYINYGTDGTYRNGGYTATIGGVNTYYGVNNTQTPVVLNYSGSLTQVFLNISGQFHNVNIYVDGVPWSLVGSVESSDVISPPDVIRNDNGLIDSQDVFVPDQELAFDLIGLINLLNDKLENLDTITFDDIITDGTILKNPDGTALDDARTHILDMTIQRVIADEIERDDPEPIPTTTPPPYPTFPEVDWRKNPIPQPLPTGFDTSNGNPADAFSGASTLAQIVDATNRGLPSELVYTFWGIVFGMIVLGIIKVLHK